MEIIRDTTEFSFKGGRTAVAIGKFDGVHSGHRRILSELVSCREAGLTPAVFTFDPDPEILFAGKTLPRLTTREEKRVLLSELGVELLVEFPMTKETAMIEPEDFLTEYLSGSLHAGCVIAGTDLSFGYRGRGNADLLVNMSQPLGYEARIVDKIRMGGADLSSTRIREELCAGHIEEANELLGRNYGVSGIVRHGRHLGSRIGFPTVNLLLPEEKLMPRAGVYFSRVEVLNEFATETVYPAVTNIGYNPTVSDTGVVSVESHLYDFEGDLYGRRIFVTLCHFHRPERKFESVDALKEQLQNDVKKGREYFS